MNSSRSRAQTEPDGYLNADYPERPASSYDLSRDNQVDYVEPASECVEALANVLGLSLENANDQHLTWLIRDCLTSLGENGWICSVVTRGHTHDVIFKHQISGEKRSDHEIVSTYRALSERIRFEQGRLEARRSSPVYRIKELVIDRLRRVKHPREMSAPGAIENILGILGIDMFSECYLARIVREELDASYFAMSRAGGPEYLIVDDCFSVDQLETRIGIERMRIMKQCSSSRLLFCVNCRNNMADGACATCGDCLCATCHGTLHSSGNRKNHLFVFLDQTVCSECSNRGADIRCSDCSDLFCRGCFGATHARGKHLKHCIQLAVPVFCLNCEISEAAVICLDCFDALCSSCASSLHRNGSRKSHMLYGIRSFAFPTKLFSCNIDSVMKVMDKVLVPPQRSPWLLFFDPQTGPYWYNFLTRQHVQRTMEDMGEKPADDTALLQKSEAAALERAMQRASFEIPNNFHLKLLST